MLASSPGVAATRHVAAPASVSHASPAPAVDHDGPFGIVIGEPLSELGPIEKIGPGHYHVVAPARPNASFTYVSVYGFADGGVCRVVASSPSVGFDGDGIKIRDIIDNLASTLQQKYGPYTNKTDQCDASEDLCHQFWVDQVNSYKAKYNYYWDFSRAPPRQDNIGAVQIQATASNSITSFAVIFYEGHDDDGCTAKIKAADAASL
jgi:hypothetical protein